MRVASPRIVVAVGSCLVMGVSAFARSAAAPPPNDTKPAAEEETGVLQFTVKDIDGKPVRLADYKGKVLLIVNTASRCGYTPQYAQLSELQEKYAKQDLLVLCFPSNDFGAQEPGSNEQIKQFCHEKYPGAYKLFSKVKVKGKEACELYKFLTSKKTNPDFAGEIKWNFNKFLVDRAGKVVGRFQSSDDPIKSKKLIQAIEKAVAEEAPKADE